MSLLIDIFGYLSVVLRALILTAQSLTVGGTIFLVLIALPLRRAIGPIGDIILRRTKRFLAWSALCLTTVLLVNISIEAALLTSTANLDLRAAFGAGSLRAEAISGVAAFLVTVIAFSAAPRFAGPALPVLSTIILACSVLTSHAAARIDGRGVLVIAEFLHEAAAAAWIGGIPYFLIALNHVTDGVAWRRIGKSFSNLSLASVVIIFVGGLVMAWFYVGSIQAIYGTAYGVMVTTKATLFAALLVLGFMNSRVVNALRRDPATPIVRLKRFAEVEIGVGITVLFAAASLTSLPPGTDLTADRVTIAEIVDRFTPQMPRFATPEHNSLALLQLQNEIDNIDAAGGRNAPAAYQPGSGILPPRNAEDIAWSEFNHHWAAVFMLLIASVALLERAGKARWGRNWPLLFLGLAVFLFVRSDPEVWPLGYVGFFASLRDPEVVQHRIFVLLVAGFGLFEWGVRTGRIRNRRAAYVFPLITATGGGLLLTHSHAISNVKDQLLIELSHVPLALAGITAGWARWLELRMPGRIARIASWVWPVAFFVVGIILLLYREA